MSLPAIKSIEESQYRLRDIKSYYTASTIHRAPSRHSPIKNKSYQCLPHIPISGSEGKMLLFSEVFTKTHQMPSTRCVTAMKRRKTKTKPTDFFYQLLLVQTPALDLELKDLLCIAELGIPIGDIKKEAAISAAIGDKYLEAGKNLSALNFFKRALVDYKKINDQVGRCVVMNRLGVIYHTRGNFKKSKVMHKRHKELCCEDFVPWYNLGVVNRALNFYLSSTRCFLKALSIAHDKDNKEEICIANAQLGLTYKAMNDLDLSSQRLLKALSVAKVIKAYDVIIELKITLAYLNYFQGKTEESQQYFYSSMVKAAGKKSDICRINFGIIKGEEKLKLMFNKYK